MVATSRSARTVRDRVSKKKASLLVQDAQFDADLAGRQSIVMQGMRSILAVPLQTRDRVIGLIYVDTPNLIRPFTQEDLKPADGDGECGGDPD